MLEAIWSQLAGMSGGRLDKRKCNQMIVNNIPKTKGLIPVHDFVVVSIGFIKGDLIQTDHRYS